MTWWNLAKAALRTAWKNGSKYIVGTYAGYEAHDIVADLKDRSAVAVAQRAAFQS